MNPSVEKTPLDGLLILTPLAFQDARGFLAETYQRERYRQAGVDRDFVQDNLSSSLGGVVRGLHAQFRKPQAKLVQVLSGEICDIAVDARPGSATFGHWHQARLSAANRRQMFIPEGFFHGFCVLSETAVVHYKCSALYDPDDQWGVLWNDPDLRIDWPVNSPLLSEKDRANMSWQKFKEISKSL